MSSSCRSSASLSGRGRSLSSRCAVVVGSRPETPAPRRENISPISMAASPAPPLHGEKERAAAAAATTPHPMVLDAFEESLVGLPASVSSAIGAVEMHVTCDAGHTDNDIIV